MFFSNIEIVISSIGESPLSIVGTTYICTRSAVVDNVGMESMINRVNKSVIVVKTEIRTNQKTFNRFDVDITVTEKTHNFKVVVFVHIEFAHRILTVAHTADRSRECFAIFFVNGQGRRHFQSVFHWRKSALRSVSQSEIFTYRYIFSKIVRRVKSCGNI